ncbi:complex I subunit 4 family protein [Paenibacillus turpanensis]|uniref:complex I subunit 4 family protein n=1 Tax=Paenibacillus turpanensis TaxID=2689078 RepID=UPI0014097773|nr:NADH-quinone oxidoreductase subunit M [Paenibacillus turpanensis]
MFGDFPILTVLTFSPLLGILALALIPKDKGRALKMVFLLGASLPLVLAVLLYQDFNKTSGLSQYEESYRWIEIALNKEAGVVNQFSEYVLQLGYTLGIDGLSLPMVFLTALVGLMAAIASVHIKKRWKAYYIWFLLLQIGMLGVFMARDLFLFFVFFEITLIPMFFLIGIWGYNNRERAANKFLIYNGIGSAAMLLAFLMLIVTAGFVIDEKPGAPTISYTANYDVIAKNLTDPEALVNIGPEQFPNSPFYASPELKWAMFILLVVAFGIKLPIFPFHTWMLRVHTEAPPSVVMIHSGILLKMGAYGLIRYGVLLFPEQAKAWAMLLAILGVINILYGAVLAFVQKEFRLVLAYSSISHMGICLLGIAALSEIGLQGAVFQMVSHGLISALMFLLVGSIYERTNTTRLDELGGLAKAVPFMAGILLVAGMASLGLPGLSGFISEFLAFLGLFEVMPIITVVGMIGIVLAAVYVLRAVMAITYGPIAEHHKGLKDARFIETIPMITLVAFILLIGIYPAVLSEPIRQTILTLVDTIQSSGKVGG